MMPRKSGIDALREGVLPRHAEADKANALGEPVVTQTPILLLLVHGLDPPMVRSPRKNTPERLFSGAPLRLYKIRYVA